LAAIPCDVAMEKKDISQRLFQTFFCCLSLLMICGSPLVYGMEYHIDPSADAGFNNARAVYQQESFSEAAALFLALESDFPWDARITVFKMMEAKAYFYSGDFDKSKTTLERFNKAYPTSSFVPSSYYFIGRIYYEQEIYDSSALAFLTAAKRSDNPAHVKIFSENLIAVMKNKLDGNTIRDFLRKADGYSLALEISLSAAEKYYSEHDFRLAGEMFDEVLNRYPEMASDKRLMGLRKKIDMFASQKASIALLAPISGDLARFGRMMSNAIELAVENYLETSTLELESKTFDTYGNSISSAINAKKISAQPVSAIIGPLSSSEAVGAAAFSDISNIPLICPTASEKGLTSISDMLFQLTPTPERMGEAMAEFINQEIGLDSVAVLAPLDNYGKQITDGFVRKMVENDVTVFYQKFYPRGSRDYRRFLLDLKRELLPDTFVAEIFLNQYGDTMEVEEVPLNIPPLFLPSYTSELKLILPQLRFYKISAIILGSDSYGEEEITKMRESKDNPILFVSKSLYLPEDTSWLKFNYLYQTTFNEAPERVAAVTYDAANMVLDCIRQGYFTSEDIWRCFMDKEDYTGASGIIRFSAQRENIYVPVYFLSEGEITRLE
jgi:branched-chain amino acid transport system substrate-binding protein